MFSVVNVYLDHLKFCVVCTYGRRYVCCSECYVVSNECNEPTSCFVQPIGTYGGKIMYFGCVFALGVMSCLLHLHLHLQVKESKSQLFSYIDIAQ